MAEHELNKIVDDDGEVYNLRDSTKQPVADKVTSIRAASSATDTAYPSEKAVRTALDGKSNTGHTHSNIVTEGDNRYVSTIPNDYTNKLVFKGLKTKAVIGNPSNDTYSYLVGLRGWDNSSGGNAHELAFNNTGIFARSGSTTTWGQWEKVLTSNDLSAEARTIPQDISKGANLVVNGSGTMMSNYNFSTCEYLANTDLPTGVAGCFHKAGLTFFDDEKIAVNTSKAYYLESWYRVKTASTSTVRLSIACFDIDGKEIQANNICYGVGTLTKLTQDLNNGDTVVHLEDLSGAGWVNTTEAWQRGFIFWNYKNSLGYQYPPETYSKNVHATKYETANVNVSAGTITLNSAWSGGTIPAGTYVSRYSSGSTYYYVKTSAASGALTTWTKLEGVAKGFNTPGSSDGGPFRPGTAFIKVGWVNANTSGSEWIEFGGIELRELPDSSGKLITARKLAVSLSNTSTDTSFDGSADVTNIKVSGTLPISNGGTGKTTANDAANALLSGLPSWTADPTDSVKLIRRDTGGSSTFGQVTFLTVWNYIKGKISSVLGLSESGYTGNAATATTAQDYDTSTGTIKTALEGKLNISDIDDALSTTSTNPVQNQELTRWHNIIIGDDGYVSGSAANPQLSVQKSKLGALSLYNAGVNIKIYSFDENDEEHAVLEWDIATATNEVKTKYNNGLETGTLYQSTAGKWVKIVYTGSTSAYFRAIGIFMDTKDTSSSVKNFKAQLRIGEEEYPWSDNIATWGSLVTAAYSKGAVTSATVILKPLVAAAKCRIYGFRCLNTYTGSDVVLIGQATSAISATTAKDYNTSTGTIKTALDGKEDKTNKVTSIRAAASATDTAYPSEKAVASALSEKASKQVRLSFALAAAPSGGVSTKYVKIYAAGSDYRHWECSYNGTTGSLYAAWLFRSYATGENSRDNVTLLKSIDTVTRAWYSAGASTWYVKFEHASTSSQQMTFNVAALDTSALPTLEAVDTLPSGATELTVNGVTMAEKLVTARQLAVDLSNTSTNTSFNGTANVTNIKTTGVLGVANGGTGNSSVDTTPTASSTKMVTSGGIYNALADKVQKIEFSQPAEYKSFVVIEDITQWYDPAGTASLSKQYQMIGQLAYWRTGAGYENMEVAFIKFHLNYRWKLNNSECCEICSTIPAGAFRPMIVRDARDANNVKYYFGLRVTIAWQSTAQFIGRTKDLSFSNLTWLPGENSTHTGNGTEFPEGITIEKDCDTLKWDIDGNAKTATTATNVSNNGVASADAARHIWFSDSGTETKRVYDNNFTYNPATNLVTANISGNAATADTLGVTRLTSSNNLNDYKGDIDGELTVYRWISTSVPVNAPVSGASAVMHVVNCLIRDSEKYTKQIVFQAGTNFVYERAYLGNTTGWTAWQTVVFSGDVTNTYSSTGTDPVNGKAIAAALGTLDVSSVGGSGKYISAISETDGKISATATTMDTSPTENSTNAVTSGGVKTALDGKEDTSNKVTAWSSTTTDTNYPSEKLVKDSLDAKAPNAPSEVTIANGDKLVITDASDSNKIKRVSVAFDGSTTGQLLSKKGTFENPQEAYLSWGGRNITGSYGPLDAALVDVLGANRFAYGKPAGIAIEYTRDGGTTWLDYEAVDDAKTYLVTPTSTASYAFALGKADSTHKATAPENWQNYKLRITFTNPTFGLYAGIRKIPMLISTSGSAGCQVTIRVISKTNEESGGAWSSMGTMSLSGWSGWNIFNLPSNYTAWSGSSSQKSQHSKIEFLFEATAASSEGNQQYNGMTVIHIFGYGTTPAYTKPSALADTGHLYQLANDQSAIFPANVKATTFEGKFKTARKLAVSLSNTSTDTSFDGSADVTNIKVSGTLPISNGGTGATTKKAAEYAINGGMSEATATMADNFQIVFSRVGSDQSATNGVFIYRQASTVWNYIKGKMTSVSGVNISGNAATATDLATNSVLSVSKGGTGKSSVTSNSFLVGNGTSTLVEKTPSEVLSLIGGQAALTEMTTQEVTDFVAALGEL